METPPAAVLLAAIAAAIGAYFTIKSHREMTRLRETFVTMDHFIWDKDVTDARRVFAAIRRDLRSKKESIAKFSDATNKADIEKCATLITIMSNYENWALGVRNHIIDECYLHRFIGGTLLVDWERFSPLITAFRHDQHNANIYIEFEGLATSWQNHKSYLTSRKLKPARRAIKVT